MKFTSWLADWKRRSRRMSRRAEPLESRCLLAAAPQPIWFGVVQAGDPVDVTGSAGGTTGATVSRNGDAVPGTWIVQLSQTGLGVVHGPAEAESFLNGFGAELHVLKGLGLPGQLLVQASSSTRDRASAALAANPYVAYFDANSFVFGPDEATLVPNDADLSLLAGLSNEGQTAGTPDADIDAPEAWSVVSTQLGTTSGVKVGSRNVVVGVVDSGIDYTHPDLIANIWLNQGEIPTDLPVNMRPTDVDGDGLITFVDLNATANDGKVFDGNGNGLIDAGDLLNATANPLWSNGRDDDLNGFINDFVGWDFYETAFDTAGEVIFQGDNDPLDEHRHGTHVAGTIGAVGNNSRFTNNRLRVLASSSGEEHSIGVVGVSWDVSLMALRFLGPNNRGSTANAIEALNYATMMKSRYQPVGGVPGAAPVSGGANVRATNNSWGNPRDQSRTLRDAVAAQAAADIVFVAAAGNGDEFGRGQDNDLIPHFPASVVTLK